MGEKWKYKFGPQYEKYENAPVDNSKIVCIRYKLKIPIIIIDGTGIGL